VLEHMTKDQALDLANRILDAHNGLVISVPIVYMPQDEFDGNPYEIHVKPDWTHSEVLESFGADIIAYEEDREIGVYLLSRCSVIRDIYDIEMQEKKTYSQNGEDGVIDYIFKRIGTVNQVAVEFGAGDGKENNTRYLAEQGWRTVWFDTSDTVSVPLNCSFVRTLLTSNNIVELFQQQSVPQDLDLLSIDVDGNDYHLRQALSDYRPRICVQEYNGCFPPDEEYIMPENDQYRWRLWDRNFGASLLSLTRQANDLGYDLVYCEKRGVNAFYVRQDINVFPALTAEQAWRPLWWASRV